MEYFNNQNILLGFNNRGVFARFQYLLGTTTHPWYDGHFAGISACGV